MSSERFGFCARELTLRPEEYCGVYILLDGDDVDYIGKSVNVYGRLNEKHHAYRPGHRIVFIQAPAEDVDALEGVLIRHFRPRLNGSSRRTGKYSYSHYKYPLSDGEVLAVYGIAA